MLEECHGKLLLRLSSKDQAVLYAFHFFICAFYKKLKAGVLRTKRMQVCHHCPSFTECRALALP